MSKGGEKKTKTSPPAGPDYGAKVHSAEPIFKLLARSATGRALLEKFLPLYKRATFPGGVQIAPYPAEIVAKLRAVIPEDQPIGACLVTEGDRGTIFLDFESPLGVLAPFLAHEIAHALDPRSWKKSAGGNARIEAEADAFQTQYRLTQELRERDADYDAFLRTRFPKAKILHQLLEFEELEELYGKRA